MTEKKQRELRLIEHARTLCEWFPVGELFPDEEPDAILVNASGRLGIEVSQLHEPPSPGSYPRRQIEEFHVQVLEIAERKWAETEKHPLDVLVYFGNARLKGVVETARDLIQLVRDNLPLPGDCKTAEHGTHAQFSVVRIMAPLPGSGNCWRCYQAGSVPILTKAVLSEAIDRKNRRVEVYRLKADRVWLLLYAPMSPLSSSFSMPLGFEDWRFRFDFNRVLLYQWERGVIDLRHH